MDQFAEKRKTGSGRSTPRVLKPTATDGAFDPAQCVEQSQSKLQMQPDGSLVRQTHRKEFGLVKLRTSRQPRKKGIRQCKM
jgi:hypothetical protein